MLNEETKPSNYFVVKSVFGFDLRHACISVGIVITSTSLVTLLTSAYTVHAIMSSKNIMINTNAEKASKLMLGLLMVSVSCYQIIITILMLREVCKKPEPTCYFKCSVWVTSHISLLLIYVLAFMGKAVVSFFHNSIWTGLRATSTAIFHGGIIFYACIIVNSYIKSAELAIRDSVSKCNRDTTSLASPSCAI